MVAEADVATLDVLTSLLDKNLDDVADLPEYLDYAPTGFYRLKISNVENKVVEINSKDHGKIKAPAIQFTYEVLEILELAKPDEVRDEDKPKAGSMFNESIFFHSDPEKATSVIKAKFEDVAKSLGVSNLGELVNQHLKGLEVGATVKSKEDKNKEGKFYIQVSNCKLI